MAGKLGSGGSKDMFVRAAAGGLGAAVGGPVCAGIGSWVGVAIFGSVAGTLIREGAEMLGKTVGEKFMEDYADKYADEKKVVDLEVVYCEALRRSLGGMSPQVKSGYPEWFAEWEESLSRAAGLELPLVGSGDLAEEVVDGLFRRTLERLAAQGKAWKAKSVSLDLRDAAAMPEPLWVDLQKGLRKPLGRHFGEVVREPEFDAGWKEMRGILQKFQWSFLERIGADVSQIRKDTAVLPGVRSGVERTEQNTEKILEMLEASLKAAQERTPEAGASARELAELQKKLSDREAEMARLVEEYQKLQASVAERAAEPAAERTDQALSEALEAKDLDAALGLKLKQVERRREEAKRLPRDLFELGTIYEMRFDWPRALAAFREAWEGEQSFEFGFRYGYVAQKQLQFSEAIRAYEDVRRFASGRADVATTLNNLGLLYSNTQRLTEAESSYVEALGIYRGLARQNAAAYLPDVAMTLNNLGLLYSNTQRLTEAESSYVEALGIRRELARENAAAYLPDVAMTLNNLAILYSDTQRLTEAESSYVEALGIYRGLARENAAAYLPDVATTLNNLAILYRRTQRLTEAESSYVEALGIYRDLARENAAAYLPDVAMTLNNLADLCGKDERAAEGMEACDEAQRILEPFWKACPEAHGNLLARFLGTRVELMEKLGAEAEAICAVARRGVVVSYEERVKAVLRGFVERYCGEG
jgi:tetratricopeptide (TPR) repeat protein